MSKRAVDYVDGLGLEQVSRSQKAVLRVLAQEHNERFDAIYLDLETLEDVTLYSRRQLRRILKAVPAILDYQPGCGRGNFAEFRFPQMPGRLEVAGPEAQEIIVKGDKKGTKRGQKGDIVAPLIRKDLNQEQDQSPEDRVQSLSSSPEPDDDIARVLRAFEESPVSSGKSGPQDRAIALRWLTLYGYSVEQIEYGMLLASARRMTSAAYEQSGNQVQSLAYFSEAIAEAAGDERCSAGYAEYLRRVVQRREGVGPKKGVQAAAS